MEHPHFKSMYGGNQGVVEKNEVHSLQKEKPGKVMAVLDFVVNFSLGAIFVGIPLFFTGLALQGSAFEKQMYFYFWVLLALVAWAAHGVIGGEMKIRRTPLDLPIFAFVLIYGILTLASVDRWHSFWGAFGDPSRGFLLVISMALIYYILFSTATMKKIYVFSGLLIFSGFLATFWTTLGLMNLLPAKILSVIPINTVGSFSSIAMFSAIMIPIVVAAILKLKELKSKSADKNIGIAFLFLNLITNLFLIFALYSFLTWIGWMAFIIGVMIFLVYLLSGVVKSTDFSWNWLPMTVFVVIMVMLMSGPINIVRVDIPTEVSLNSNASWNIAKEAMKKNFFLGSGPSTYGYDFSLYHGKDLNLNALYNLRFYQGAGLFFEGIPTLGVIGFFFLAVVILSYVSIAIYLLNRSSGKDALAAAGFFAGSSIFIINIFTSTVSGPIFIIGSLVAMMALLFMLNERGVKESYLTLSLKASPRYALVLAFIFMAISASVIFMFVFVGKAYLADISAGKANSSIVSDQTTASLIKAVNLFGKEGKYFSQLGQQYGILANNEAVKDDKTRDVNLVTSDLNNSIAAASQAIAISKNDVGAVEVLAQVYENSSMYVQDSLQFAMDNYKKALELEPNNPIYYLKIGEIRISQAASEKDDNAKKADIQDSKNWFQKAIDQKGNFAEGYYQIGLSEQALNDLDGSVSNFQKAIAYDNSSANYFFALANALQQRGTKDDLTQAENLYNQLVSANDKDANVHFGLGTLYEKMKRPNDAIAQYKKVVELIGDQNKDAKTQILKMIDNVNHGVANTPENLKTSVDTSAVDSSLVQPSPDATTTGAQGAGQIQ